MADRQSSEFRSALGSSDDSFWLIALLRIFLTNWKIISALSVLGLLAGLVYGLITTPMYEARLVMVPATEKPVASPLGGLLGNFGGIAGIAGGMSLGSERNEALALLRSRAFTEQFIVAENLMPVLFSDQWDAESGQFVGDDPPSLYDGYITFDTGMRSITENLTEGTISLSLIWRDRFEAANWANSLVARLNQSMRERTIFEANQTLEYLNKELEKTSIIELRQVIYGLVQENIRAITMANVRKEYAFRVIDPAAPSDENSFVRPRRMLLLLVGGTVGFLAGFFLAFTLAQIKSER